MKKTNLLCLTFASLAGVSGTFADVLAGYDFDDGVGAPGPTQDLAADPAVFDNGTLMGALTATVVGSNVTASDYAVGAGLNPNINVNNGNSNFSELDAEGNVFGTANGVEFGGARTQFGFTDMNNGNNLGFAINNEDYMTFTVTPEAGFGLGLTSFTFRTRANNLNNSAERWALFSSIDGFEVGTAIATGQTTDLATWDEATNNVVVSLSELRFQALTAATEFRLYIYGGNEAGSSATLFDKVILNGSVTDAGDPDSDGDDLLDAWELLRAGNLTDLTGLVSNPGPGAGTGDFDGDNLSDLEEFNLAVTEATFPDLDPTLSDTDGEGLSDFQEVNGSPATNPTESDTDLDGLNDQQELSGLNQDNVSTGFGATNPIEVDSDADGVGDGDEVGFAPPSDPNTQDDTDGDGIANAVEDFNVNGTVDAGETDALNPDTDGDNLSDGFEDANQNGIVDSGETNPLIADTDEDGLNDDVDGDPLDPDQDDDGVLDGADTAPNDATNDSDGDGIGNDNELLGNDANGASHGFGPTDPNLLDSDRDGLDDGQEIAGQNFADASTGFGATNPNVSDTDGDRFNDGNELLYGGNPNLSETVLPDAVAGYTATGADWLTAFGANDIDGDGALGSDGFIFFGRFTGAQINNQPYTLNVASSALPNYLLSDGPGADFNSVAWGFPTYGMIDDPLLLDGTDQLAGVLVGTGGSQGSVLELATFEIAGLAEGQTVRVGVLGGTEGNPNGNFDSPEIILAGPNDYLKAGVDLEINPGDSNAGWLFFDITDDGVYTVSGSRRNTTGGAGFGGLTFDSIGGPEDLVLCIERAANGSDLILTWASESGSIYDIRTTTDLSTPPSTWDLFRENVSADPSGTNTETFPRPEDSNGFFILEER